MAETCLVSVTNSEHTATIEPSTYGKVGDGSVFTINCNDPEGYVVYAVGNGKDTGGEGGVKAEGNTDLVGTKVGNKIVTGLNTSGTTSNWSFKLSNPTGGLTINSGFEAESVIPSVRTAVASKSAGTSVVGGDSFTADYSAYISSIQAADNYSGEVKYVLFHPSTANAEGEVPVPMQNWQGCDELTQDDGANGDSIYTTLVDERDGNEYKVAKLKDGKCWMIDNLKIAGKNISSTDSDMESGSFSIPAATDASTFKTDSSNVNNSKAYVDSYGGLYTWYTATAGTGDSSIRVNATGSICPKGWKLPTSGSSSSGDFADLVTAYGGNSSTGSTNLRHTPVPGFTYAGSIDYYLGSLTYQGSRGFYWSSTSDDSTAAYILYLNSSLADPATPNYRVYGSSVRCLARE